MKNILLIGVVFWLLFLNGFSTLTAMIPNNAPQVIVSGANRVMQTVQSVKVQPQPIQANFIPVVPTIEIQPTTEPTSTPVPLPTETPVVIVVTALPEAARMPTEVPLPTFPPAIYPSADQQYAVHETTDKGYTCDCVYIYTLNKRVCWNPGIHPSEKDVRWIVGMTEAGHIKGEEIPVNEQ